MLVKKKTSVISLEVKSVEQKKEKKGLKKKIPRHKPQRDLSALQQKLERPLKQEED